MAKPTRKALIVAYGKMIKDMDDSCMAIVKRMGSFDAAEQNDLYLAYCSFVGDLRQHLRILEGDSKALESLMMNTANIRSLALKSLEESMGTAV